MGNLWRLPFIFSLGVLSLSSIREAQAGWSMPIHDIGMEYKEKVSDLRDEANHHLGAGDEKLEEARKHVNNASAAGHGICPPDSPLNMCTPNANGSANGEVMNASVQKWQGELAVTALNAAIEAYDAAMSTADKGIEKANDGRDKVDEKWNEVHEGACMAEEDEKRTECFEHIQKERELRKLRLDELKEALFEIKNAAAEKKGQAESMRDAAQTIVLAATAALNNSNTNTTTTTNTDPITPTGSVVSFEPQAPGNGTYVQGGGTNTSTNGTSTLTSTNTGTRQIAEDDDGTDNGSNSVFDDNSAGADSAGNFLASSRNSKGLEGCFSGNCLNGAPSARNGANRGGSSSYSSSNEGRSLASNRDNKGLIVQNLLTVSDSEGTQLQLFPMASLAYAGCSMNPSELGCQLKQLARAEAQRQQRARTPTSATALPIVNR